MFVENDALSLAPFPFRLSGVIPGYLMVILFGRNCK
jgi:hypothetical protein